MSGKRLSSYRNWIRAERAGFGSGGRDKGGRVGGRHPDQSLFECHLRVPLANPEMIRAFCADPPKAGS